MWGLLCNWVRLRQRAVPLLIFVCTSVKDELFVFQGKIYCDCLVTKGLVFESRYSIDNSVKLLPCFFFI